MIYLETISIVGGDLAEYLSLHIIRIKFPSFIFFQKTALDSMFRAVDTLFVVLFKSDLDLRKSLLSNLGLRKGLLRG